MDFKNPASIMVKLCEQDCTRVSTYLRATVPANSAGARYSEVFFILLVALTNSGALSFYQFILFVPDS